MKIFYRIAFIWTCVALLTFVAPSFGAAADLVRYSQRDKNTGEYEEGTRSGTVKAVTRDGVEFEYVSNGAKKTYTLPSEQTVWIQYDAEPMEAALARVEIQVGNYAEALEKLKEITDAPNSDLVAQELDWNIAYATVNAAFAGLGDMTAAAKQLKNFVANAPEHYRYYEANALLGDACAALELYSQAEEAYGKLDESKSAAIQARGKVGRAQVAAKQEKWDEAKVLFEEVAQAENAAATLEGLNAQTDAKIGLARALAKQNDAQGAEKTLEALLDATPNSATRQQARIYNALGDLYAENKQPQKAIVAYLHVDLLYPAARTERVKALQALVPLWRAVGRPDRAKETRTLLEERFQIIDGSQDE